MDHERWVKARVDDLKYRELFLTSQPDCVPSRLADKFAAANADERNKDGETLLIGVVKYVVEQRTQVQYLNVLLRAGADVNAVRPGRGRGQTALMLACQANAHHVVARLMLHPGIDVALQDTRGNTALMYAVLARRNTTVTLSILADFLIRKNEFRVLRLTNCLGLTAERLALRNGYAAAAKVLARGRLQVLHKMHRQLALIHLAAGLKGWFGWSPLVATSKAAQTLRARATARRKLDKLSQESAEDYDCVSAWLDARRARSAPPTTVTVQHRAVPLPVRARPRAHRSCPAVLDDHV